MNTKDSDKGGQPVTNTDRTSQQTDMAEEENAKKTVKEDVNVKTKSGEEAKKMMKTLKTYMSAVMANRRSLGEEESIKGRSLT